MTPTVTAVRTDASVVEAAQLMRAQDIKDVLVTENGQLVGLLTDRDITLRAVADGYDPLAVDCRSVCTTDPVTVGPDDDVRTAGDVMRTHALRRLPVTENGRPLGQVSLSALPQQTNGRTAPEALARHTARDGSDQNGADA